MRREKIFQGELARSAKAVEWIESWLKLPDEPFSPPRPYDIRAKYKGQKFAIELKADADPGAPFRLSHIKPHQWDGLQEAQAAGYVAGVLFNRRYGRGSTRINLAFWFPLLKLIAWRKEGVKAIPLSWLRPYEYYKKIWPLKEILDAAF